jgi:hypothetical protein
MGRANCDADDNAILKDMHSVADDIRQERARTLAALTAVERIDLALRLGDDDLRLYCQIHDVDEPSARAAFMRARAVGRLRSVLTPQPT